MTVHDRLRRAALGVFAGLGAMLVLSLAAPAAAAEERPDQQIERISAEVLERIRNDPEIREGNLERVSEFVDEMIMPNVDFVRTTALSVGPGWRQASPEQRKELVTEFRALLLRTYAGALAEVRNQSVRVKPLRAAPDDDDVIVRSEVIGQGAEPIELDYRMRRTKDNWKIYDVNVLGVWFVETYRSQFAPIVNQSGIEGLIDALRERNVRRAPAS